MRVRTWIITLIILALFLHLLPYNWLIFIPIVAVWFAVSAAISTVLSMLLTEWLDD